MQILGVVKMKKSGEYYLGLDIGTDSVGYAVTDQNYTLRKFKGEPIWGTHLFESGNEAADRRLHRTNRRRIDRRQQRVALVNELFAEEIVNIDPYFFVRRKESALFPEDTTHGVKLFAGEGITDKGYYRRFPTIHHLILELMISDEPHDVRLVYIACAWLVAHRGHFLFDIVPEDTEKLLDFGEVYEDFRKYLADQEVDLPWNGDIPSGIILEILQTDTGIRKKQELFKARLYDGSKISKEPTEGFPYSKEAIVSLLSGGKVKPEMIFANESYAEVDSVSLQMGDEEFDRILMELGDDGELLVKLRAMYSCAKLIATMANKREHDPVCISSSKVAIYEQHKRDLMVLKRIVKKYCPMQYNEIFRKASKGNYVAYSGNVKSCPDPDDVKGTDKIGFSDFLKKKLKGLQVSASDQAAYEDIMARLETCTFLPKQRDTDNRVIPQQLYRQELAAILKRSEGYLPMLTQKDADGLTVSEKLLSIFDFRIPYYVGPLVKQSNSVAWIERKQGKILPWNFEQMVDLDVSEQLFIKRMTNHCTYLPGEDVLPVNALLYEKFVVLNELNNLKVDGAEIPVQVKQELYTELFLKTPKVTVKRIREHLVQRGHISPDAVLSGLDVTFKSGLRSHHIFKRMLDDGVLSNADVEQIILHMAYSEDRARMCRWLKTQFPKLSDENVNYILRQKLKNFGRLSGKLLDGIYGTERDSDGEAFTIIEAMWNTNRNLMQLLSDRYTYTEQINSYCREYYSGHPQKLSDRLSEMYVSNAAKRPIFRTLDIVTDVVKATGTAPKKIFVEMARGGTPELRGKRTESRKDQLLKLYKSIKNEDAKHFAKELENMGAAADNRLQDRKLYLYYLQMGKCMYTGRPIDLSGLADGTYNLEHIYPQSQVKDDSLLNNLVLVESEANGQKSDTYPVAGEVQTKMRTYWLMLKNNGLITEEKYRRLTRTTPFTAEEKLGFINRQLVETRQSTKVITTLLKERFPSTEIVCVKSGLVSEFRQAFGLLKCRAVNDLHHAKDAYLNIVVGNVYQERFTKAFFRVEEHYNVQTEKLFASAHQHRDVVYWKGGEDLAKVKKTMAKNAVHLTRYAFYRKGGLFDQQPVKKAPGLIPLKEGLPTEKYGGYNKPTATSFLLMRFSLKGKPEVMLVPVELRFKDRMETDAGFALRKVTQTLEDILKDKPENVEPLLGGRLLKINTVFSFDGTKMALAGKSSGGLNVLWSPLAALVLPDEWDRYAKKLESFQIKRTANKSLQPDEVHDGISKEKNLGLYQLLTDKLGAWPFVNFPGNQHETLVKGVERFGAAELTEQIDCLLNILQMMGPGSAGIDLTVCGGKKSTGSKVANAKLSNWKKRYSDVRILDESASGLFSSSSGNLLELL